MPAPAAADAAAPAPEEEPNRRERARSYFRDRPRAKWILFGLLLALIAGGVFVWHYYAIRESTDDAQIDGHIDPVSARVGGTAIQVNFDNNQYVTAGSVMVQLDPTDYKVALQRAEAELADAKAQLAAAETGVPITTIGTSSQTSVAEANLESARKEADATRARLGEAEANYNKAASDLKRYQQLIGKDEISRQQYDTAVAAEQSAASSVAAARSNIAAAQGRVAQAEAQLRASSTAPQQVAATKAKASGALATVQKDQAQVQQAELNLSYTTVKAPVNGIVSQRNVEPGQVIQPGQPVFAIVNLDDIYVTANFKETQLKNMHPGQPAEIKVDAYGRTYRGHVLNIGGATGARFSLLPPENATGNYVKVVQRIPVRIVFEKGQDPEHLLRPGMSVTPTVLTK
ncbi:MAG: HlyD family secretion protein [Acidobacteria bacterium]|nr:HlyD family secretion protein [Acidobacteriota bacterium]